MNCKTCKHRIFDPLWTEYKCRLKRIRILNVDKVDCKDGVVGDPISSNKNNEE